MVDSTIQFPIRLRCAAQRFILNADTEIRAMTDADRPALLGIESATLDDNIRVKSYVASGFDKLSTLFGPELDHYDHLFSSNYVATVPSRSAAQNLNLALKLTARSCTSLWIGTSGYSSPTKLSKHFLGPPGYHGAEPLTLDAEQVHELDALYSASRNLDGNKKLQVMKDIFLYAMSTAPREESRCIELSIILEMLLLPKASTELSYRFALRLAKIAAVHLSESSQDWFEKGRQIYGIRSRLVHSGQDAKLTDATALIEETARRLLALYVTKPNLFEESALDALCVAA